MWRWVRRGRGDERKNERKRERERERVGLRHGIREKKKIGWGKAQMVDGYF